jgi:hypothetical protein
LCHDFGKPLCARYDPEKNRIRSLGHDEAGAEPTLSCLRRLTNEERVLKEVPPLVRNHMAPYAMWKSKSGAAAIRRLALRVGSVERLLRVCAADDRGRPPIQSDGSDLKWLAEQAELLRRAEVLGCDSDSVIQAYNYGIGYLDYTAAEGGGVHTSALGEEYARIRSDGRKHPYFHPIAIRSNGGWKYSYGNMFYVRLVKRYLP